MLGGRLRETENKRNFQISGLKLLRVEQESQAVVAYERVFETLFDWEEKRLFKSGCLREMVVMRELTVSYRERDHNIHAHELYTLLFALILLRPTELWPPQGCETRPTVYPRRLESLTLITFVSVT